jgi:hypothetical protein
MVVFLYTALQQAASSLETDTKSVASVEMAILAQGAKAVVLGFMDDRRLQETSANLVNAMEILTLMIRSPAIL